jgi:hypothetical protein
VKEQLHRHEGHVNSCIGHKGEQGWKWKPPARE